MLVMGASCSYVDGFSKLKTRKETAELTYTRDKLYRYRILHPTDKEYTFSQHHKGLLTKLIIS